MSAKVFVNYDGSMSQDKVDSVKCKVADALGICSEDVVLLPGVTLTVVEVPDALAAKRKTADKKAADEKAAAEKAEADKAAADKKASESHAHTPVPVAHPVETAPVRHGLAK